MLPLTGPAFLLLVAIGIGYAVAPPIKHAFKKVEHTVVHLVTFGKKA